MTEFIPFPKIPRLNREIVVTEKLDGTNAQIHIAEDGTITAASRSRWIKPGDDNFGFAAWVDRNKEELAQLGPGSHFGEWWGQGIQRGYGIQERRFSLFNTNRWYDDLNHKKLCPDCCDVVPLLYRGEFDQQYINGAVADLVELGSAAVRNYMNPEGIIIYHTAANQYFKVTCKDDNRPKMWREVNGAQAA